MKIGVTRQPVMIVFDQRMQEDQRQLKTDFVFVPWGE